MPLLLLSKPNPLRWASVWYLKAHLLLADGLLLGFRSLRSLHPSVFQCSGAAKEASAKVDTSFLGI